MRQKFFDTPFGNTGDQTTIPDPTQVSGSVSFEQGWPFNYQRNLLTDPLALPIDRATMNYLFYVVTQQLQQYQTFGFPEWITSANNGGSPYAYDFGAVVRYSATGNPPFTTYTSVLAGTATNTDTPGATANWQPITLSTAQIQAMIEAMAGNYYLDTGAANAYVIAMNPPVTAYTNGMPASFRAAHVNTGASTLNAGGGVVPLLNDVGAALVAGDIPVNSVVSAAYDTVAAAFLIKTLVPSQVLSQTSADARYVQLTNASSIQGLAKKLLLSATGTNANISVSADEVIVESAGNLFQTLRAVALTLAGTSVGANGLDAGTIAANNFYSVWVIWNGTTTAGLLSLSATAPTLPSGYTYKARIGWIFTDNTANKYPFSFIQKGRKFQYVLAAGSNMTALPGAFGVIGNPTVPTWVAFTWGNFAPSTIDLLRIVVGTGNTNAAIVSAAPNNAYGAYNSASNPPPVNLNTGGSSGAILTGVYELVPESANIYVASNAATASYQIMGWDDGL